MRRIGKQHGLEVFHDSTDTYYVRVPVGQDSFGAVHDLHKRVPVGKYSSYAEACKAIARKFGNV